MIRFYAALLAPQNHDTEFQWSEFDQVCEDVLSNQYGNLAQRLLVLARERYEGRVPSPPDGWSPDGAGSIGERVRAAHERISQEIEKVHLKEALDLVLAEVRDENRRFHEARPWSAGEDERRRSLYEGLWHLKAIAMWSAPFLPFSSAEVLRMLGYTEPAQSGSWEQALEPVASGQPLGEIRPLFPRRERERATPAAPAKLTLGLAGPVPLGLQSAVIRSADDHPSADKLYVLRLDVGGPTPRTVVAGLRPYYRADELRERRVVLLSNLEPRTIRRVTSQGMILAADSGDRVLLLAPPEDCPPGTLRDGSPDPLPNIRYEDFERAPLLVGRVTGVDGPLSVQVDVGGRTVVAKGHPPLHELVLVQLDSPDAASGEVVTMNGGRPVPAGPLLGAGHEGTMSGSLRIDLHVHSTHSPDSRLPLDSIPDLLGPRALSGFALTDHNTIAGHSRLKELARDYPRYLLVPGVEVSTAHGHLLALGVDAVPPKDRPLPETIDWIRSHGGVSNPRPSVPSGPRGGGPLGARGQGGRARDGERPQSGGAERTGRSDRRQKGSQRNGWERFPLGDHRGASVHPVLGGALHGGRPAHLAPEGPGRGRRALPHPGGMDASSVDERNPPGRSTVQADLVAGGSRHI